MRERRWNLRRAIAAFFFIITFWASGILPVSARTETRAALDQIEFIANIETAGILVRGVNLPADAELFYRRAGESNWRAGPPLKKIEDGLLAGSLFGLFPATAYEVAVRGGGAEIFGATTTQPDELSFTPARILYVNAAAAPGGDGSPAAPFQRIRDALSRATAGTQILVADGIYRETLSFAASGAPGAWIQLKAQGAGAILDGSKNLEDAVWTRYANNVWYTKINSYVSYLARDGQRFYRYDDLNGLTQGYGHSRVAMTEGWYVAPNSNTLYVRSADHPSKHSWQVPFLNIAVQANAQNWLWVEGFEIRYYGAQFGCGVCLRDASHVVIRNNKIHHVQKGIMLEWTGGAARGNDARVEYNEIYDSPVNEWPWRAVKATSMEGTAIILRGRAGTIARGNKIHHIFNGIYSGSSGDLQNMELALDADIYYNYIYQIGDDAFEPEGACVNQRFRNNAVDSAFVGVSLAPVTRGPVWVTRSAFTNYFGRGIKVDLHSSGAAFIYHNTFWTNQNVAAVDFISAARNLTMRNNIFQTGGYGVYELAVGSTGHNWNYDNFYTRTSPRFKWEGAGYENTAKLCRASGLECNGHELNPGLASDLTLQPNSPNIDRGERLPGINDFYYGAAPDVGAFESPFGAPSAPPTLPFTGTPSPTPTLPFTETPSPTPTLPFTGAPSPTPTLPFTEPPSPTPTLPFTETPSPTPILAATLPPATAEQPRIIVAQVFRSIGSQDGWILEAGEGMNRGGWLDRVSNVLFIGDDDKDRQYKSVISFNTEEIPDDALIESALLILAKQGVIGTTPLSSHGSLTAELNRGPFSGNSELVLDDFSSPSNSGAQTETLSVFEPLYSLALSPANLAFINKNGATQFRLSFQKDDDDDMSADVLKIFSGNAEEANQPQLIVTYSIPVAPQAAIAPPSPTPAVNHSPEILSPPNFLVAENILTVGILSASDSDLSPQPLTYSILGGEDAGLFSVQPFSGELSFRFPPNFEQPFGLDNVYKLLVGVSDGELIAAQEISITVLPMNDNPPGFVSPPNFVVAENALTVGLLSASDFDLPLQPLTYSILGGADAARFSVDQNSGLLSFVSAPDFERPGDSNADNVYEVVAQVSDGMWSAIQNIKVSIADAAEAKP